MLPLARWSPFRDLSTLHNDMDDLFARVFQGVEHTIPRLLHEGAYYPPIDMNMKEGKLYLRAEVPGMDAEDVDVSVTGNVLAIKGERKTEHETEEGDYYIREISSGNFERRITLPADVETDKVKATFKGGILEITMPIKEVAKSKKVEVESVEKPKKLKAA